MPFPTSPANGDFHRADDDDYIFDNGIWRKQKPFTRDFDITLPATVAEDAILAVLDHVQEKTQVLRFEVRGVEDDAAVQEFEAVVSGQQVIMSQIAFIANNSYIKEIQLKRRAANNLILAIKFTAAASGKNLLVRVSSSDGYLNDISTPLDTANFDTNLPTLNGLKDYPDPEAQKDILDATSGDADIQIPQFFTRSSRVESVNQIVFSLAVPPKRFLRATFLAQPAGAGSKPQIIGQRNGGWINWGASILQGNQYWNDRGTYDNKPNVADIAYDNSGCYFYGVTPEAGKLLRTVVEMTVLQNNTEFKIHANAIRSDGGNQGVRNWDCVIHYGEKWDDFNYIGYKIGSTTFNFIEAYIQWE